MGSEKVVNQIRFRGDNLANIGDAGAGDRDILRIKRHRRFNIGIGHYIWTFLAALPKKCFSHRVDLFGCICTGYRDLFEPRQKKRERYSAPCVVRKKRASLNT